MFKSQSQRRKFYAMAERGEISKAEVAKWEKETGKKKLPEKVKKKSLGKTEKKGATSLAEAAAKAYEKVKAKSPPGEGGRFKALTKSIAAKGKVENPAAVAAAIGRKKYGKEEFQAMATVGKKRKR